MWSMRSFEKLLVARGILRSGTSKPGRRIAGSLFRFQRPLTRSRGMEILLYTISHTGTMRRCHGLSVERPGVFCQNRLEGSQVFLQQPTGAESARMQRMAQLALYVGFSSHG